MRTLLVLLMITVPMVAAETTFSDNPDEPFLIGQFGETATIPNQTVTTSGSGGSGGSGGGGGGGGSGGGGGGGFFTVTAPAPEPASEPDAVVVLTDPCADGSCDPPARIERPAPVALAAPAPVSFPWWLLVPALGGLYFLSRVVRRPRIADGGLYLVRTGMTRIVRSLARRPLLAVTTPQSTPYPATTTLLLSEGRGGVHPSDVEELHAHIETFLAAHPNGVVVLDGIERIAAGTSFRTLQHVLRVLRERIAGSGRLVLVPYAPDLFDKQKREQLEKDFNIVR